MKNNISIDVSKNQVSISVDPKIYDLEVVFGAAYVYLERAYIYLDGDTKGNILVYLKGKEKLNKKQLENLGGDFCNELINYSLRYQISKRNKKIREYIVSRALIGALGENGPEEFQEDDAEEETNEEWKEDSLGIAVPWEEKYTKDGK